jgi:putative oxidoreductase
MDESCAFVGRACSAGPRTRGIHELPRTAIENLDDEFFDDGCQPIAASIRARFAGCCMPLPESEHPMASSNIGNALASAAGRVLLASLFVVAGVQKLQGWDGVMAWMESAGVSGGLLPYVVALEIGGGLAIALGWKTRLFAALLAMFTVAAGALFHADFGDETQFLMFMKNIVIAGGFLVLAANGGGALSLDELRATASDAEPSSARR